MLMVRIMPYVPPCGITHNIFSRQAVASENSRIVQVILVFNDLFRLLFNPFVEWFRKGPVARQIHRFMWSDAPLHYKISMLACPFALQPFSSTTTNTLATDMFSYYGIAAGITIAIINYILLGFQFPVDGFYIHSFEIWLATTVVFYGTGNVGYSLLEYRLGHKQLVCSRPPIIFYKLIWFS